MQWILLLTLYGVSIALLYYGLLRVNNIKILKVGYVVLSEGKKDDHCNVQSSTKTKKLRIFVQRT